MHTEAFPQDDLPVSNGNEGDEAGYTLPVPETSPADVLASYRTYRQIGGDPFEPYEVQLQAQINAELASGKVPVADAQEVLAGLMNQAQ